jgi:regulatory protein
VPVISLKTGNHRGDGAVEVEFSDGSSLVFTVDYLPEREADLSAWETSQEISADEEEAIRFAAACYRAEKAALRLIARAEQHSLGLTAKLGCRGHGAAVAKAVVSRLLDRNLLDDERYAELWIRSRLASGKTPSPRWLLGSLAKRGIDRDSSREALKKVLDSETEYALLLKYLEMAGPPENKKPPNLRAQLRNEGFSSLALDRYFEE